jgi:hypothetical protein
MSLSNSCFSSGVSVVIGKQSPVQLRRAISNTLQRARRGMAYWRFVWTVRCLGAGGRLHRHGALFLYFIFARRHECPMLVFAKCNLDATLEPVTGPGVACEDQTRRRPTRAAQASERMTPEWSRSVGVKLPAARFHRPAGNPRNESCATPAPKRHHRRRPSSWRFAQGVFWQHIGARNARNANSGGNLCGGQDSAKERQFARITLMRWAGRGKQTRRQCPRSSSQLLP